MRYTYTPISPLVGGLDEENSAYKVVSTHCPGDNLSSTSGHFEGTKYFKSRFDQNCLQFVYLAARRFSFDT
jgi:hypothetical protein